MQAARSPARRLTAKADSNGPSRQPPVELAERLTHSVQVGMRVDRSFSNFLHGLSRRPARAAALGVPPRSRARSCAAGQRPAAGVKRGQRRAAERGDREVASDGSDRTRWQATQTGARAASSECRADVGHRYCASRRGAPAPGWPRHPPPATRTSRADLRWRPASLAA